MSHYLKKYFENTKESERSTAAIAYLASLDHIESSEPKVSHAIIQELKDQRSYLKLIASENYSSLAVQLAMGNLLTDKYAEGYPFHRFYAGCENVDTLESMAQEELKSLFGAKHAYVQPHSGADANLIAFWAVLTERVQNKEIQALGKATLDELTESEYETVRQTLNKQKVMGLALGAGGHLTHGYRHNISSKMMQSVSYGVDPKTGLIDYEALKAQVIKEKPLILLAGYSAYPRKINFAKMRAIADEVNAVLIVDMAHFAGLVAGKVFQGEFDPIPYAHIVTSTTHKTLRGPRGGIVLANDEFSEAVNKGCPLVMGGPLPHVIAAKAIAFKEANTQSFRNYASKVVENASLLAKFLQEEGLKVLTNGTENHLLIVDLTPLKINGRQAETLLRKAHLTLNRNSIPNDPNGPWYTSGIRVGTPALTTLGMGEKEMAEIAKIIASVLKSAEPDIQKDGQKSKAKAVVPENILESSQETVARLLKKYPLYPEITIDE